MPPFRSRTKAESASKAGFAKVMNGLSPSSGACPCWFFGAASGSRHRAAANWLPVAMAMGGMPPARMRVKVAAKP